MSVRKDPSRSQQMNTALLRTVAACLIMPGLFFVAACSDAATRVAYDIESGTRKLGTTDGNRAEITHTPRSWPDGCAGSYTLRIERGKASNQGHGNFFIQEKSGGISVSCFGDGGNSMAWGTTYHLRFVDVLATVEVTKNGGEAAVIDIQRVDGRAVLVGLH